MSAEFWTGLRRDLGRERKMVPRALKLHACDLEYIWGFLVLEGT